MDWKTRELGLDMHPRDSHSCLHSIWAGCRAHPPGAWSWPLT